MMELETPRVPKSNSPASWERIQVAIRQRAPTGAFPRDLVCTESTITVNGRWSEFHRVFGPREKNQKVLNFAANAIRMFRNGESVCIIGFGDHNSGVSWTLGTNPTSNGLVPSIFRYLKEEKLETRVKAEWVPVAGEYRPGNGPPAAVGIWQTVSNRQDLKHLLQDVVPPPETHSIIWFSTREYPRARLAVVDLCQVHYPLARHLRQNSGSPCRDNKTSHDHLIVHLEQVLVPGAFVAGIGCISDSSSPTRTNETLNYALSIAGRLPTWARCDPPLFEMYTPEEPLGKESPVLVTPNVFGESLVPQNPKATSSPLIDGIMHEHATISADDETTHRMQSPQSPGLEMSTLEYYNAVQKSRTNCGYF